MSKLIFTIYILIILCILYPVGQSYDFYDLHVAECEAAHNREMTYSICSGFNYEPAHNDFYNVCAVHPEESCKKEVWHTDEIISLFGVNENTPQIERISVAGLAAIGVWFE